MEFVRKFSNFSTSSHIPTPTQENDEERISLHLPLIIILQYIQYSKLKRIIKRRRFVLDRDDALADSESASHGKRYNESSGLAGTKNGVGEYSLLQPSYHRESNNFDEPSSFSIPRSGGEDESDSDFFKVILSEIEKVNKFFVG